MNSNVSQKRHLGHPVHVSFLIKLKSSMVYEDQKIMQNNPIFQTFDKVSHKIPFLKYSVIF
jgi:hypothetical protein